MGKTIVLFRNCVSIILTVLMCLITRSVVFLMLLSIIRGEINNKIEVSATCDEIEQKKAELDEKYCWFFICLY